MAHSASSLSSLWKPFRASVRLTPVMHNQKSGFYSVPTSEHRLVLTSRWCLSSSSGCRLTTHVHVCVYIWRLVRIVRHACVELVHNVMEEQRTYTTAGCCIMCTVKACKGSLPVDQSLQRHCLSSAITRCKSCFAQKQVSGLSSVSATWTSTANGYWCAFYLHRAA